MDWFARYENNTELYTDAQQRWPCNRNQLNGRRILASFDDESIIVYQAYNNDIGQYACENGHFIGCPSHNHKRMTCMKNNSYTYKLEHIVHSIFVGIKTNFLWMMYRSNWASRSNQQCILAIWLRRSAFDGYLARSIHTNGELDDGNETHLKGRILIQWDPDHHPDGTPVLGRRAMQLGLKNIDSFLDGRDILRIVDVTPFVRQQYLNALAPQKGRRRHHHRLEELRVPIEHVYEPNDGQICRHIQIEQ